MTKCAERSSKPTINHVKQELSLILMKRFSTELTIVAETEQHSPHQQWEVE